MFEDFSLTTSCSGRRPKRPPYSAAIIGTVRLERDFMLEERVVLNHFVTNVPTIMGNIGWVNAQKLQQKWFADRARRAGNEALAINSDTIKMNWVLGYPRAKAVYDDVLKVYANDPARKVLEKNLRAMFARTTAKTISFGDFTKTGNALHLQQTNFRPVDDTKLDDLGGALGKFSFYSIPKGTATENHNGSISVTIREVGVYVRDDYNFEGEQPLGYWKQPDGVRSVWWAGYTRVDNSDYREYRVDHGRGGDFIVFSDVRVTRLQEPNSFRLG